MNIILRELKANLKSFIIWALMIVVFIVMVMTEFSAYAGNEQMLSVLDAMPKQLLDAFKFGSFNLTTVTGFFGIMYSYFALMLGIHAILIGNSIISKEEKDKTVEFSLVLPVKRSRVITSKLIAAFINCLGLTFVLYFTALFSALKYMPENNFHPFLFLSTSGVFIVQLIFLSIGILLGCAMKRYKKSGYIGVSIILVTYIMTLFLELTDKLDFLKYLTPFKYFDTINIKNDMSLDIKYILLSAGIIIVCITAAYLSYRKRDLYI
ncbi:MAG: ABC transporter permease subunit [Clostridia bacterium]|nr:ABC transporter permease subunit [Clostridia bacterium]